MKNVLATIALLFIIPFPTFAAVNPGVEFLTPLVQTIIGLLQDRIGELSSRVAYLEGELAKANPVPQCTLSGSVTPEPVAPIVTTPVAPPPVVVAPLPQSIAVSYVYRTDAPYVMVSEGATKDRCPTFTLSSSRPFFMEKLVFEPVGEDRGSVFIQEAGDLKKVNGKYEVVMSGKSGILKTFRVCYGDSAPPHDTHQLKFVGSESLFIGSDGKAISVGDTVFSY